MSNFDDFALNARKSAAYITFMIAAAGFGRVGYDAIAGDLSNPQTKKDAEKSAAVAFISTALLATALQKNPSSSAPATDMSLENNVAKTPVSIWDANKPKALAAKTDPGPVQEAAPVPIVVARPWSGNRQRTFSTTP